MTPEEQATKITDKINSGDLSEKPGWVRLSLHPTMEDDEVALIGEALRQISKNHKEWGRDYTYNRHTNEFRSNVTQAGKSFPESWLSLK